MSKPYIHTEEIHNLATPRLVVPLVFQFMKPTSVLDVGCGTGTWLKIFEEHGVTDYIGIDGDFVERNKLKIPEHKFIPTDLQNQWTLRRRFDLVVSLEVAEHLSENVADDFVAKLTEHADIILFSASIPGQGGQNHINEQWPAYWERKFLKHGYYFHDALRPLIWNNDQIEWWYKQNIFLVKKGVPGDRSVLPLVHPELYKLKEQHYASYCKSLKQGKQGLKVSTSIFVSALLFKVKSLIKVPFV